MEGEKQHIIVPDIVFFKSKAINYKLEVRKARTRQVYAHKINQNTAFVVALENKSKQEQKGWLLLTTTVICRKSLLKEVI